MKPGHPASSRPASPTDRVEVILAPSDTASDQRLIAAGLDLLSDEERARADRFFQPADRGRFVIGRWLARTTLSRYADVAPRAWPLAIDERGRPHLRDRPAGAPDLRFNLSHTHGLVACAITIGREVGVDVEFTGRRLLHDVPERFFSAREVADLRACAESEQPGVFFDYWTLKESYIKARGLGLALPLRHFSFLLDGSDAPTVTFAPDLDDDPATWQFRMFRPGAHHRLAVAVRRRGADLPILIHTAPDR
jgi:4'-phosphopantetheinyl transferase